MSDLPLGWGDRKNQMSEHDMKLGGIASTKFGGTAKNAYEADSGNTGYKTDDQVRDFYMNKIQNDGSSDVSSPAEVKGTNNVPDFWEERQKERDLQAKQMGAFSRKQKEVPKEENDARDKAVDGDDSFSAELALVQISTHTLQKLAKSLQGGKGIKIPLSDRAAFAKAMKEAMDALGKQA